jgi:primosomal protein N' (replication factor Y)
VLACDACGWLSNCPHCESFAAFHKTDGGRGSPSLRCHHCGWSRRLPAACPTCGNQDLAPVGQGTQRVEEALCAAWPQARVARIDRDTTRRAHAARRALEAVHAGDVDILVGTQMIAKGHDFRRVSTVAVLNADAQLVAPDFRAPERLFALLMQVAGRAGRGGQASRVLIQTRFPAHPLFAALARHDYAEFARTELAERRSAKMPPFVYQALLTAHARTLEAALEFLRECRRMGLPAAQAQSVELYEAVPMPLARLASESRAQLLIESTRRRALHAFLDTWLAELRRLRPRGGLRWRLEMDPMSI